jgi:hypothetical protein
VLLCIGWIDLVVGGLLLVGSVPTLLALVIVEVVGSRPNDNLGNIGVLAVITLSASAATWSGCLLTFRGVHLSKQRIRTSTDLWFKFARRDAIAAINIERSLFRNLHRAVAVAQLRDGRRLELLPLSIGTEQSADPLVQQQIEVINDLRGRLGLAGSDDAPARPVTKSDERKFVRLLPQERLLWTVVRSRYGRYDNAVAEGLEAAHGQRGRFLLSLGATNVLLGAIIFLIYLLVCIATGASSLWPGYVFGMVFVAIGVVRIVQAVRSQPDGSAGPSDAAPPVR